MVSRVIPVDPFDLVIFGGTGDLARRKILPGLFRRYCAGQIEGDVRIIGAARGEMDTEGYRQFASDAIVASDEGAGANRGNLEAFLQMLHYVVVDAMGDDGWEELAGIIRSDRIRAFYFSVAPRLFGPLAERLHQHGLADGQTRIVVEKPFGRDLASAKELNSTLAETGGLVAAFDGELGRMRVSLAATGKDVATLERGLSKGLRKAFDGVILDGDKLSDALDTVTRSMLDAVYASAVKPVTDHFGSVLAQGIGGLMSGILPFADGGSFSQGRVMPFANGGVVSGPTYFPMRGSTGLMGEAGPEAIMPLTRGRDGKLGVRSEGGGSTTVVMNVTTPDVEGFRRSQSQIAAQMGRALGRGQRIR